MQVSSTVDEKHKNTVPWTSGLVMRPDQKAQEDFDAALSDLVRELGSVPPPIPTPAKFSTEETLLEPVATTDRDDKTIIDARTPFDQMESTFGPADVTPLVGGIPQAGSNGNVSTRPYGSPSARRPATLRSPQTPNAPVAARRKVATDKGVPEGPAKTRELAQELSAPVDWESVEETVPSATRSPMVFFVIAGLVGAAAAGAVYLAWSAIAGRETSAQTEISPPPLAPAQAPAIAPAPTPVAIPVTTPVPVAVPPALAPIPTTTPLEPEPPKEIFTPKKRFASSRSSSSSGRVVSPVAPLATPGAGNKTEDDNPYADDEPKKAAPKPAARPKQPTSEWENPY